jgi:hypothetical protein
MGSDSNRNAWRGPTGEIVDKVYPDVRVRNEGTIVLFSDLAWLEPVRRHTPGRCGP